MSSNRMRIMDIFKSENKREMTESEEVRRELEDKVRKAKKYPDDYRKAHKILSEAYYIADENDLELPKSYYHLSNKILERIREDLIEDIETCLENDRSYFARAAAYSLKKAYERLGKVPPKLYNHQIGLETETGLTSKSLSNRGGEK